jgi:hypothetical protein
MTDADAVVSFTDADAHLCCIGIQETLFQIGESFVIFVTGSLTRSTVSFVFENDKFRVNTPSHVALYDIV